MTTKVQPALSAVISNSSGTSVKPTDITPKKIEIDFNRPLREHLDSAAVRRGWQLYKVAFKKAR
jgi:hypothetical protein